MNPMVQYTTLERELATFEKNKAQFLERFPGFYVVVKGDNWIGPFPDAESAYEQGLNNYGLEPFLVRQVVAEEPIGYVPAFFSTQASNADL